MTEEVTYRAEKKRSDSDSETRQLSFLPYKTIASAFNSPRVVFTMKYFNTLSALTLLASFVTGVLSVTPPGGDTPLFYFVSSSGDSASNFLVCLNSVLRWVWRILQPYRKWSYWSILFPVRKISCTWPRWNVEQLQNTHRVSSWPNGLQHLWRAQFCPRN